MNPTSVFNKIADEQNWNIHTKLSICLTYIEKMQRKEDIHQMNVRSCVTFEDHVQDYLD